MTGGTSTDRAAADPARTDWLSLDACRELDPGLLTARVRRLGGSALGEALARVGEVVREPLEYRRLPREHELDHAARSGTIAGEADPRACWARRAVYRLASHRILVTEVFLPALQDRG
jgi:chorismate-pyruvate lyase